LALISQNFKNDTISATSNDIQPIVIIAKKNNNGTYKILDLFSNNIVNLKNNYNEHIKTKEILDKISSVKNSIDYNTKKLKVNIFRFSIRNYLNFNEKLTNSEKYNIENSGDENFNNFIGSYVILYYKTPTTNILNIDINPLLEKDHCSIMFVGIINRITQNNTNINIQAEDYIQSYITDKVIPKTKIIDLNDNFQKTLITDDLERVPMVYGSVDRSRLLVNNYDYYADKNEVYGYYFTYKARPASIGRDFNLYVKGDNDWLGIGKKGYSNVNDSVIADESVSLIPEVANIENLTINFNGYGIIKPNAVYSDSSSTNPIFDMDTAIAVSDNYIEAGQDMINNNGFDFVWYRDNDQLFNTGIAQNNVIEWNNILYSSTTHTHKDGRWILFQYPKEINMYRVLSDTSLNWYNAYVNPNMINDIGTELYFKPINGNQWREVIKNNATLEQLFFDEVIEESDGEIKSHHFPNIGTGIQKRDASGVGVFDPELQTSGNIKKIIYMPMIVDDNNLSTEADDWIINQGFAYNKEQQTNKLLIFEYFNDGTENSFNTTLGSNQLVTNNDNLAITLNENQSSGVYKGATIKDVYIEHVEDVDKSEVYGCVNGRKDLISCEDANLINDIQNWQDLGITSENITLNYVINGIDETAPINFDNICNNLESFFINKDLLLTDLNIPRAAYIGTTSIKPYQHIIENYANVNWLDINDPFYDPSNLDTLIFNSDDNYILRLPYTIGYIFQYCYLKLMFNVLEKEVRDFIENKTTLGEPVYTSYFIPSENDSGIQVLLPSGTQQYDPSTMNEDIVGYGDYLQMITNIMVNIYNSNNENSVLYNLIPENNTHFIDIWHNNYSEHRKALYRRILKYLYVSDLNADPVDNLFTNYNYEAVDLIPSSVYNTNDGIDSFAFRLRQYLDDTMITINSQIYDHLSTENEARFELYVWDDKSYSSVDPYLTSENNNIEYSSFIDLITNYGAQYPYQYQTDGFIVKPVDIIFDILVKEMEFGINETGGIDVSKYDVESIEKSRQYYGNWKMGFSISEEENGKKIIEDILSETMSFFTFTPEGKFTLITIKDKYSYNDIDHFIKEEDCINYSFSKTKREDLVLQSRFNYRYDNGYDDYPIRTQVLKIEDILSGYDGYNYYNLDETTGYKEKNLRFHTDVSTANNYHFLYLLNNCNTHLNVKLELPLAYAKIQIADLIHLPLINNDKVFGLDYSKVQFLNAQAIYPLWIVTSIDIKLDKIIIEAYQLHYLGTDGLHGFEIPEVELLAYANTKQFNTNYPEIHNWNYTPQDPSYTYIQAPEIPYGDINGNGDISIVDIINLIAHIMGDGNLTEKQFERIANYDFVNKEITENGEINISKVVSLIQLIIG